MYLWKNLVISQDGSVVPCCVDYDHQHVLGSARWQSIEEIWNGEPMRSLRQMHVRGRWRDVALCGPCRPLTYPPAIVLLASFVDDAMRRKIMPDVEDFLEPRHWDG